MELYTKIGYEGVMVRDPNARYCFGRTSNLLKWKRFHTMAARIVDSYEGKGKHQGRLGGVVTQTQDGVLVDVGTGFSDEERTTLWAQRHQLPGRSVVVKYQERTQRGVPRFPVFAEMLPEGSTPRVL
jgi:DNA ligase-1